MRRLLLALSVTCSCLALAQNDRAASDKAAADAKKAAKETELKKKDSVTPDTSLAGDITRKKEKGTAAPALQYDQFRLGVEVQVASKRREQIEDLKKIISLTPDKAEMPKLLFRLGELYFEESKGYFFDANRKDDDLIRAMNANDEGAQVRIKQEKEELLSKQKEFAKLATDQYAEIVQRYKDFDRTDEVLYFLGHNLMEMGDERKSLAAFKRLIEKHPKSRYLPDAHLAFGEYYFNLSKGKRDQLTKSLESYQAAEKAQSDNAVVPYAIYKQGWCHFNLGDYEKAMDRFKTVVLLGSIEGEKAVEKASNRKGLVKEARNDYVRSYGRLTTGSPGDARDKFAKLASAPDDRFLMMKQLGNLYYEDGNDKNAALTFDTLIKERPTSPEAPGFQSKIVDCVLRAGNKRMTVQQVRRLVKIVDDVKKANKLDNEKDKRSFEEAKELSERLVSRLAVDWHNEAKKTRDQETFELANEVYADYLVLFPDSGKAYDLRFFWAELLNDNLNKYDKAAEQYTTVLMTDIGRQDKAEKGEKGEDGKPIKPGKWMVNAAYNAILSNDEVVKIAVTGGAIKPETTTDPTKKLTIPPQKKALLEACERYLKYVPAGEKRVEIAYKAAKIYYDHNHLDEATARFAEIALKSPDYKFEDGGKAGEIAANLVLDAYNLQGDWAKVNEWARKFYAEDKLAVGKFKADLALLIEQSSFKLVNQLEAKKEFGKAAEAYLTFVNEFPKSDLADKALFNASIDFFNARMLDRAIEVRKRIITQYPKSQYVPQTLYALAEGYEAIADFDNAADYYEKYASEYERSIGPKKQGAAARRAPPKKGGKGEGKDDKKPAGEQIWDEGKAQIALFNAGIFRDGLGAYRAALADREKYLALWPDSKDAEAVFLSIVDLHEKNQAWGKALKQLEEYEKKWGKDANKMLTAEGRIASIYEEKLKSKASARKIDDRILKFHDQLSKSQKAKLEIAALDAVARAHFVTNEDQFKKYTALKLRWSKLTNIGEFQNSVKEKAKGLEGVQKLYTTTVGFKSADPAICALHKIGLAYDHFADALLHAPTPKGMPEDLETEFRLQLDQQVTPVKSKAAEAFTAAVQKSQELDVFNPCTTAALEKLRDGYAPEQFPKMRDDVLELKFELKGIAIGGDVLNAIQPLPTVGSSGTEVADRGPSKIAGTKDVAVAPKEGPREQPAPSPSPKAAPKKTEEPNDEPL